MQGRKFARSRLVSGGGDLVAEFEPAGPCMEQVSKSRRLGVLGTGMIGGSFALAVKRAGLAQEVVGFDAQDDVARRAVTLGVIDRECASIEDLVASSDMVLVAVPVVDTAACVRECLARGANLVMEAASVKGQVLEELGRVADEKFASVHPIAGTDQSGPEAARADMFHDRLVLVMAHGSERLRQEVSQIWSACGATCLEMEPDLHDRLLAVTSHLPHLLAFCYMNVVGQNEPESLKSLVGPGFRDFTRIARADALVWQSIFSANRLELSEQVQRFQIELEKLQAILDHPEAMRESLRAASETLGVLR